MRTWRLVIPLLAFTAVAGVGPAVAEALLPPLRPAAADVQFNPASCGKAAAGTVSAAHLVAKTADRTVGPYTVSLDAFSNPGGPDTYRPILIEADAGSTLRIDLDNQLAPRAGQDGPPLSFTNLHTHGLIVRPTPYDPQRPCPGDSIYQHTAPQSPSSLRQYRIDVPTSIPASFFGLNGLPVPHPAGLFWFHAHFHTTARAQVTSGLSGLISIGDPMTHLRVDREDASAVSQVDEAATRALRAQTDVSHLALRDIQLVVPACAGGGTGCQATDTLPGQPGADGVRGTVPDDYKPDLCTTAGTGGAADPYSRPDSGFCGKRDGDTNAVWLFTVNGQLLPTLSVAEGRNQLLRIANLSASVTYVLDLVDATAADRTASERQLCVISLDGVVTGSTGPACSGGGATTNPARYANVGFPVNQVLLMPGSRAQVFIAYDDVAADQAGHLMLRTLGLNMGNSETAITQGDTWPAIELARIEVAAKSTATAAPTLRANLVRMTAAAPVSSNLTRSAAGAPAVAALASPPVPFDAGMLRRVHSGCVLLPPGLSHRRQVIFDEVEAKATGTGTFNDKATYGGDAGGFALGSRIVDRNGSPERGTLIGPVNYAMPGQGPGGQPAGHTHVGMDVVPTGPRVCPVLGRDEVWELTNYTTETHNFHIHQGKFRLARSGDPGLPAGFRDPIVAQPPFGSPVTRFLVEASGTGDVQAWHDTIPVPPRLDAKHPSRVYVLIPFRADQQVGSFVFHCHILEHEDRGMMADIEVVRPR